MQDILKIIILSITSALELLILTKLMGNKEISQLSLFDYIIGITIGSIAAEMATSLENNYLEPFIAMIVYAFVSISISFLSYKSIKFRRFLSGNSLILLDNGELYKKNFKIAKLDLNDFLAQCRSNGYFNINDIQTAILECNGIISFLPKSAKKPATVEDLNLLPKIETVLINVIIDGHIILGNLKHTGNDLMWLTEELRKQNITDPSEVFLATCNCNNELSVYKQNNLSNLFDFFE